MVINIAGDFVVSKEYNPDEKLGKQLVELFANSDYNIVNLEAPITNSNVKILKTGPHIKGNIVSTLKTLQSLNINLVTMANNHIRDYGDTGVLDTLDFCQQNNIATVGAGNNAKEAAEVFYINTEEGRIALVNIAENEWASATEQSAGANGMDLIKDIKTIKEAKQRSRYVFVIVHGGHEYFNLPSPRIKQQYRFYVDSGADLVVSHHTHCLSGFEEYNGIKIFYGIGNFLFTKRSDFEGWYTGMILQIKIKDGIINTHQHFTQQSKTDLKVSLLENEELNEIQTIVDKYSAIIEDETRLKQEWVKFVKERSQDYLRYWSPLNFVRNKYLRGVLGRLGLNFSNKKGRALYYNLMRSESHKDLSLEILDKYLNEKNN